MKTYIDTIECNVDIKVVLKKYTVPKLKEILKINGCVKYSKMSKRELTMYLIMLNACRYIQNVYIKKRIKYVNDHDPITLEPIIEYTKCIIYNRIIKINNEYYCTRYILNRYADYILSTGDINDIYLRVPLSLKDICKIDMQLLNNGLNYPRLKVILSKKPINSYEYLMGLERQLNDHVTIIRDFCTGELYLDNNDSVENQSDNLTMTYLQSTYFEDIRYIVNRIRDVDIEYAQFVINDIIEYIKNPQHGVLNKYIVNKVLNIIYNI